MVKRYKSGLPNIGPKGVKKGGLNPEFALALKRAHGAYYARHGVWLAQDQIGMRVGKLLGVEGPSQQKVQTWFSGREPAYLELRALAAVLETTTVALVGPPIGIAFTEGEATGTQEERESPDAHSLQSEPDPDLPGPLGVGRPEHPPEKPRRPPDAGRGGKDDRSVKKKTMH